MLLFEKNDGNKRDFIRQETLVLLLCVAFLTPKVYILMFFIITKEVSLTVASYFCIHDIFSYILTSFEYEIY